MNKSETRLTDIPNETKGETEKPLTMKVEFLFHCNSVEDLISHIEAASKEGDIGAILLSEFEIPLDEVISNIDHIAETAKNKKVAIILAPRIKPYGAEDTSPNWDVWQQKKLALAQNGVTILDDEIERSETGDSVGFYFDPKGKTYTFPKSGKYHIHRIPDTFVGVSICAELNDATPQDIENLDVQIIYNPSLEANDNDAVYRMIGLHNPNITDAELDALLEHDFYVLEVRKDGQEDITPSLHEDPYIRQLLEETKEPPISQDEIKKKLDMYKARVKDIIQNHSTDGSFYIKHIKAVLARKNILVLRTDGTSSGIMNPLPKLKVDKATLGANHSRIDFSLG
ncbi:MAG: hypothetical protein HYZ51_02135 [Candidatus Doudnabacteria bacterium]|nr:hypothetical protein [Candidatus Doudnabacteria bacterium]